MYNRGFGKKLNTNDKKTSLFNHNFIQILQKMIRKQVRKDHQKTP
jgi:hypothetical protein